MKDINYMCTVIQDYIYHRKDKRVVIQQNPFDLAKIIMAYNVAINWFRNNSIR